MKKSVPIALLIQTGCVLLGVIAGSWVLVAALIPQLGLGQVERIRQLGIHIKSRAAGLDADDRHSPLVVLLGDSITREGVDAARLSEFWEEADRSRSNHPSAVLFENWAISGCSLAEQRIQLPKVLQAKPDVVVFALGPSSLTQIPELPLDKAYAYAYAGFDLDHAAIESLGISSAARSALKSQRWQQQLHFRSAPKSWLNQRLRGALKGNARNVDTNWTTPYLMTSTVGSRQLEWHLDLIKSWWTPQRSQQLEAGSKILDEMVTLTKAAGARPVLVAVPIHPQLAEAAEPLWSRAWPVVQAVARAHGGSVIDARRALDADRFADALHPNREGRHRYSQFLGSELQQPILTARK